MNKETIAEFAVGERLDKALATAYPQYSRSALEKLIANGDVSVNGSGAKTKYRLKKGDSIEVDLAMFNQKAPEIDLPVIYEDDNVIVINKPAGVLTHAKGTLHNEATVATWLKAHVNRHSELVSESGNKETLKQVQNDNSDPFWESNRAGIVHRLDRGTSGVMICAKTEAAQGYLQKQFANRKVVKTYLAVINGKLPKKSGSIDIPIERNPKKPATFRAGVNGKSAQTDFKVLSSKNGSSDKTTYSLIELKPHTGRTHQLRVHLAYLKHPIVGDSLYGGEPADRMLLHAKSLELTLPNGQHMVFEAPLEAGSSQVLTDE